MFLVFSNHFDVLMSNIINFKLDELPQLFNFLFSLQEIFCILKI